MQISRNLLPFISSSVPLNPKKINQSKNLTHLYYQACIDNLPLSFVDKLASRPKILKQISILNTKVDEIEKELQSSKKKIELLEGGKAAQLPWIGFLLKLLCKCYNRQLIALAEFKYQSLKLSQLQYTQDLAKLFQSLPITDESETAAIFDLEYQLRLALEDLPEKEEYLIVYSEKILPLIQQMKQAIKENPYHFVVHAAAAKGKAVQAGLETLKHLSENQPIIEEKAKSNHTVYLLEKAGVVFKQATPKAKEEEIITNSLLALMSKDAIVGSFHIHEPLIQKFGIQITTEESKISTISADYSSSFNDQTKKILSKLNDVEAKPFIKEMILMKELYSKNGEDFKDKARIAILDRLTPEAEFNAILTGEVQLLDMYANNLGVTPESSIEYERFKNLEFILPSGSKNFKELIKEYLGENLSPDTPIQYIDQGITICKPLSKLPELLKALNGRWNFVIFDTDLSLAEDNRLQQQTYTSISKRNDVVIQSSPMKQQHLIPLRSVLLESDWKDKPLSAETIYRLMNSEARDYLVKQWIKRLDAPIYKQLPLSITTSVMDYVAPIIHKYHLSQQRRDLKDLNGNDLKNEEGITITLLKKQFAQEICDPHHHYFLWKILEEALSFVRVRSNDSWETIAKKHKQSIESLKLLNSGQLIPGKMIKIKYDLLSSSPTVAEKRTKIAHQLFPRITYRQQIALLERQERRTEYLKTYQDLLNSKTSKEKLLIQLEKFIIQSTTPLSSMKKEDYLNKVKELKEFSEKDSQKILELKNEICKKCQPSYFNLLKAMYPLLADAYALNFAIHQNEIKAGKNIGLYTESLEKTILETKKKFPSTSCYTRLADSLQNQINTYKTPSFFGHWRE